MDDAAIDAALLRAILQRIPEGMVQEASLIARLDITRATKRAYEGALRGSGLARRTGFVFDPERLSIKQVKARAPWSDAPLPVIQGDGLVVGMPVMEARAARLEQLQASGISDYEAVLQVLADSGLGFRDRSELDAVVDDTTLERLLSLYILREIRHIVYDPLYVSSRSIERMIHLGEVQDLGRMVTAYLLEQDGATLSRHSLEQRFGAAGIADLVQNDLLVIYRPDEGGSGPATEWVTTADAPLDLARRTAAQAAHAGEQDWRAARVAVGETLRPQAQDGGTLQEQVTARSYTLSRAAKTLGVQNQTIEAAVQNGLLNHLVDPDGRIRIPALDILRALEDESLFTGITGYERVNTRDLATVTGHSYMGVRRRLQRARLQPSDLRWAQVKGRWGLPEHYHAYQEALITQRHEQQIARDARIQAEARASAEEAERAREAQATLRKRLLDAFPTWYVSDQPRQAYLHIGGPNSGKTHDSLEALSEAGSGWYLAPLRLLAFEVFDRLNARGIPTNLLTGEERIDVPGATITSATVEMLQPLRSGECVVIDEAQMLADLDRGWAWTRAMMEARAPELHVIAPATAKHLTLEMLRHADVPTRVIEHQRLAPIAVAGEHWPLDRLPDQTILVAFSRRTVLDLKTQLERMGRMTSVVYGGLPPDVRRRQADRFASGESEICIATDAVGMGLNLPADNVCFYEIEKFDGQDSRLLNPGETQQIGGRAGRFGLSIGGLVSTVLEEDLPVLRELFFSEAAPLPHATVAPTVQALELIPGTLAEKLATWAHLQSIPEGLRALLVTANLTERIELANMLSDDEVRLLGLTAAVRLINAPTRKNSHTYWRSCASAMIAGEPMPLPIAAPQVIDNGTRLEATETSIACADIYLWLGNREEFAAYAPDFSYVRELAQTWSQRIDDALLNQVDTTRRCAVCGRPLTLRDRHKVCLRCNRQGRGGRRRR
jgi:hypothetical protein